MNGKNVLWVGDGVVPTGFATVSEHILRELHSLGWNIAHLAINFNGDPHSLPWKLYRAAAGGDLLGIGRLPYVIEQERPDVIVVLGDPWVTRLYIQQAPQAHIVGYLPVDAPNQWAAAELNGLRRALAYTTFGARELRLGGYYGPLEVVPHGVDAHFYHPMPKRASRQALEFPEVLHDAWIAGNINRNQPRKKLDLTLRYWATWWHNHGRPADAYLLFHCALADEGHNLRQLALHLGVDDRLIFTGSREVGLDYSTAERLRFVYNSLDLQVSTSLGEGWGLTTHEGMACGVPQIVPDYSALGEWARGGVTYVPCTTKEILAGGVNTFGGVADEEAFIAALDNAYRMDLFSRARYGSAARKVAADPKFSWPAVGKQFNDALVRTLA